MDALIFLINVVLQLIVALVLIRVIFSWLVSFEVMPARHPIVAQLLDFLYLVTEPILEKVRRVVPLIAGIDLSPLVVIVGVEFLRRLIIFDVLYKLAAPSVQ